MFLKKDNSTLIDIDGLEVIPSGTMHIHYWDNQQFPILRGDKVISDSRKAMRDVYENYEEAKLKNKKLKDFITKEYNSDKVCSDMVKRLSEIKEKLC